MICPNAIKDAEESLSRNVARYVTGDRFDVLDFRRENSINYYVRMVFDHENEGTHAVYISGDIGEAVVYPTCYPDLKTMADCFTRRMRGEIEINESYFIEKIKASSDLYFYTPSTFDSDLRKGVEEERYEDPFVMNKLDEWLRDHLHDPVSADVRIDPERGAIIGNEAMNQLSDIVVCVDEVLWNCGRRVCNRVVMWLVAMRLAQEQIENEKRGDGLLI